ncbi:CRISPR-associated helicase Cas3' [Amycolatopsis magusensis]|uniref:CRISPR-associated helicase Cas3' n=1 Tax=Amycolatopsis magusensis TaxID=882444 RepID=UPI0024A98B95|nr:CRISPR-associated helicase Cas3' [Amycolatopsis magusensis]MDI5982159.1 CRISPR-associated helicase Cas3' [Amycolatopsis magusensis]
MDTETVPLQHLPWGKSSGRKTYHPLVCHMIDTASTAQSLFTAFLGPQLQSELGDALSSLDDPAGWISVLCGLHDLGKYAPVFQALDHELASRMLGPWAQGDVDLVRRHPGVSRRVDTPHGLITAVHMKDLLVEWGASGDVALSLAVALGGHHGYFPPGQYLDHARRARNHHGGERWRAWRTGMVARVLELRGLPSPESLPWAEVRLSRGALVGLASLTSVSDWIASDEVNFPSPPAGFDLVDYARDAPLAAERAVERVGLARWRPPADTSFRALFGEHAEVHPVQQLAEDLVAGVEGPCVLVVEAPTGEGKTKLALQVGSCLVRRLGMGGLVLAMPTQATSNQVLGVVTKFLADAGDDTVVNLVHSNAREVLETLAASDVGRDEGEQLDVAARAWFTRKKSLLGSWGVCTVDQVLKGAIRSGHVFVRLAALANKVVVIDEVHAYDTYMSTLLDRLLMWLGCLGTPVVLLSATLPSQRRAQLIAAWQAGYLNVAISKVAPAPASTDYPRITIASRSTPRPYGAGLSALNEDNDIVLHRLSDDEVVETLLREARAGRCVAVVHNLVRRARDTYEKLAQRIEALPEAQRPRLFGLNGTLETGTRRRVEQDLLACFGPEGARPSAIVVGTQVLEQSLDLDFDYLITDMAPIDALIQRAGRLHRHHRTTTRGQRVLAITGVGDTDAGPVFPPYLHTVYSTLVLLRTWAKLRNRPLIKVQDVPGLIDAVYGGTGPRPAGWETAWDHAQVLRARAVEADQTAARTMYVPPPFALEDLHQLTGRDRNPGATRRQRGPRR